MLINNIHLGLRLVFLILYFSSASAYAQKKDSAERSAAKIDTLKSSYVNIGKIAAKKALIRSAILPGLGQIKNGVSLYRIAKVAAIYTGGTLLTLSFIDNNKNYHTALTELQARSLNNGASRPGNFYELVQTPRLIEVKNTFRRNKEVVIFSFVGLYAVNIVEAYVDARLKYFDVGNDLAIKFSPATILSGTKLGYNVYYPGLKISCKL
jgi:hypothetical protein